MLAHGSELILLTCVNRKEMPAAVRARDRHQEDGGGGVAGSGKSCRIQRLQEQGAVGGDYRHGINVAPALAQADLGIAMGAERCGD